MTYPSDPNPLNETYIVHNGIELRRRDQRGPRGGKRHIYQAASASPQWGYWYETAEQAAQQV